MEEKDTWNLEKLSLEGDFQVCNIKKALIGLAAVAQWIEHGLRIKGLLVQFPVRAHAWVVGQVPSRGIMRDSHTLIFLSLSFSFTSPLSKNKK